MRPATLLSALVLGLIALAHLVRLALRLPIQLGTIAVPLWTSVPAALLLGALAVGLVREGRRP